MDGSNVHNCVAAVVSAFQAGADIVQSIRERSERRGKRSEQHLEQAVEEKMLQKALMEAATRCHAACSEHRHRFGPPFEVGDATATSALKEVMVSLQTQVISALQIARAVEDVELDFSHLYEAAITNKNNTLRAMTDLCQRLSPTSPSPSPAMSNFPSRTMSGLDPRRYHRERSSISHAPAASNHHPSFRAIRQDSCAESPNGTRHAPDAAFDYRASRHAAWASPPSPSQTRRNNNSQASHQADKIEERNKSPRSEFNPEKINDVSAHNRHDSALGSEQAPGHRPSASTTSAVSSDSGRDSSSSRYSTTEQPPEYQLHLAPTTTLTSDILSDRKSESSAASTLSIVLQESNDDEDRRAESAPEVLTKEFESMLTQQPQRRGPQSYTPRSLDVKNIHPAFRDQYTTSPGVLDPEPDRLWSPLQRPAKINDYHGFCKGAWAARGSLQEGLNIAMIPNYKGETVPHWKCKVCEFRSKGVNNTKVLPDQIYFSASGIRYRWVFLTKSHVYAREPHSKPDPYAYGCVFCAAQGHETRVYKGLEALMGHITNKHKTISLTPEVLEKTRCIVGATPDRTDDWDINIPASHGKKIGGVIEEFVVSAITGFR